MAGPEDSTSTSSQHHHHHHRHHHHHQSSGSGHGQNPDPFRLPGDDVVSDQDCELADRLLDNPKHQGTVGDFYEESSTDTATASTMRPGNDNLRIDFRNGNGIKRTSIEQPGQSGLQTSHSGAKKDSGFSEAHASEQSERKFSIRSIQSDDDSVFGSADTHDHLFFIEADDEDDDNDNDNDNDNELEHNRDEEDYDDHSEVDDEFSAKYYEDDVSDDDFDNENRTQNLNTQPFPHTTSTDSQSTDLKDNAEEHSQDSSNQPGSGGLKRSPPRPILRRSSTSNMYTMCRQSHSSGLMVRCQMNRADPMTAASCPPFFCPLWTNLVPLRSVAVERGATASGGASQTSERRRRYTVGSKTDQQQQQQQQQGQPGRRHAMQDDPRRPGFVGRGRSYSDSDVQRLLMVEVGQELRRISDEFNFFHVKKGKLTTVSESTSEEDFGPEV